MNCLAGQDPCYIYQGEPKMAAIYPKMYTVINDFGEW